MAVLVQPASIASLTSQSCRSVIVSRYVDAMTSEAQTDKLKRPAITVKVHGVGSFTLTRGSALAAGAFLGLTSSATIAQVAGYVTSLLPAAA